MKTLRCCLSGGLFSALLLGILAIPAFGQTTIPGVPPLGISSPTEGAVFYTPTNILLQAGTALLEPPDGLTNVEFFAGTNNLGSGNPSPGVAVISVVYSLTWTNPAPGDYALTAVGMNAAGISVTSAPVSISVLPGPAVTYGYITAVLRSQCANSPTPPPPVGSTRVGPDYVIETVADADPTDWTNAQRLVTDAIFESLMPLYCALPETNCVTNSVQWNIITYDANGSPLISGCAASGCQLHSCQGFESGPPVIISQPADETVNSGQTATFSVDVSGAAPLSYQWVFDGTNILDGATNAVLVLSDVQTNQAGIYQVVVLNSLGGTNSQPATLTVNPAPAPTNPPPLVRIISPPNGAVFDAPVDIPLFAYVQRSADSTASVDVEFYDGTNDLGPGLPIPPPVTTASISNSLPPIPPIYPTNVFLLVWTNAPAGNHVLTAHATISFLNPPIALETISPPVDISVLPPVPPPTNLPPIVNIVATDPVAIEGTNCWVWPGETNSPPTWAAWPAATCNYFTNYAPKTATFTVSRFGETNEDLTVEYAIGGTASNGVDYIALPGYVTIPAGERGALITIVPIDDGPPGVNKTVVLTLVPFPDTVLPPPYLIGNPSRAAAVIIDPAGPSPVASLLPDQCFRLAMPGPNAAWFCIECSTNLADWTPICTNQVINGTINFIDPDAVGNPSRFYRVVPLTNLP